MNILALGFGGPTDIAIVAIVVLVLFGGAKLAGFGRSIGQGVRGFKEEVNRTDDTAPTPSTNTDSKSE